MRVEIGKLSAELKSRVEAIGRPRKRYSDGTPVDPSDSPTQNGMPTKGPAKDIYQGGRWENPSKSNF